MSLRPPTRGGFTLIEILLAAVAAALVLTAVYGVFRQAVRIRDSATERVRDSRVRLRAENLLRADLRGALVSGGLFANVCVGDSANVDHNLSSGANAAAHSTPSNLPGYLRLTTTTARNDATGLYGDVQQVEYYIAQGPHSAGDNSSGVLVRSATRDLLDNSGLSTGSLSGASSPAPSSTSTSAPTPSETTVLAGVQSFQVSFYDGSNWQTSWQFSDLATRISPAYVTSSSTQASTGQTGLPAAVRIDIQQAPATAGGPMPPPLSILVPWTTQPYVAATPAIASSTPD